MHPAPLPTNEARRLAALRNYQILDTPADPDFDDLVRLAATICGAPIALISLVDAERQWFKARLGIEVTELPRETSFCGHVITNPDQIMVIPDTYQDVRFADNPLVTGEPKIRFYAGAPLVTTDGDALGTICVVDQNPHEHELTSFQQETLRVLSRQVMVLLEQRRVITELAAAEEQLRYERDLSEAVIHALAEGIVVQNANGEITACNSSAEQMLGLSFEQMTGRTSSDPRWRSIRPDGSLFSGEEHPAMVSLRTGKPQRNVIMGLHTPDSTLKWLSINAQPIVLPNEQRSQSVVTSFFDITDQLAVQAALRESEQRYRSVVDNIKEVIFQTDDTGSWIFLNRAWTEITGFSITESLGQSFIGYVHPDDRERNMALFAPLIAQEKEYCRHEVRYLTKDGSFRWIEVFARLTFDKDGTIVGTSGTLNDVTERRRAEIALRTSESQQRAILDNMTELVFLTDANDRCITVNAAFARFFNRQPEEFIGLTAKERISTNVGKQAFLENLEIIRTGIPVQVEQQVTDTQGNVHWHEIYKTPIFASDNTPLGLVGVIRDITERKEVEVALQQAKEWAEAAVQARSAFLATMSHEIRTPLNGVIGMTGLLLDTALNHEQREYGEAIRRSGEALLSLINDILDFSKIEAGKLELEEIDFDLRIVVEDVVDLLAEPAERKNLALSCRLDHALPSRLRGDPSRLRQILTNLVGNAVKFTERGEVLVSVDVIENKRTGTLLSIRVADSGIGMSETTLNRLFQPFMQADVSTTRLYGGTGLGLAISQQLVTMMGGNINATSMPGHGSVFSLSLPFALPLTTAPRTDSGYNLHNKRILVVDDTPSSRALLMHILQPWCREITVCASVNEAMIALLNAADRGKPYDLALIDVIMPAGDGFALTRAIKANQQIASCAIILMTAHSQRGYSNTARETGAAALITKPIRQSILFDTLMTVLSGKTPRIGTGQLVAQKKGLQPTQVSRAPGRILIVEDNQVNQKVASRMLEKLGYQADVVASGREALDVLAQIPYRLVLMDCHMPEMDGFTATGIIRKNEGSGNHIPIIALTANALAGERERCLAAGMDDYLAKPIQKEDLAAMVARWSDGKDIRVPTTAAPSVSRAIIDSGVIKQLRALQDNDDDDIMADLSVALITEVEQGLRTLRRALMYHRPRELVEVGHLLKGSSAALGATAFAQLWAEVEQHGNNGNIAAVQKLIDAIDTEWVHVQHALKEITQSVTS
ncbi:MAG: PAS domain S-box protein [Oscillochloris sp.]|nr:PAS domain S-box protein [Oscillochloris sp.]